MIQARASVRMSKPPHAVFSFLCDPSHDPLWRSYLVASTGSVTGRGSRLSQTYAYEGGAVAVEVEVAGFDPPERIVYAVRDPFRAQLSFRCRAEGEGTRVSAWLTGEVPARLMPLAGRIRSEAEQVLKRDLAALKRLVESA